MENIIIILFLIVPFILYIPPYLYAQKGLFRHFYHDILKWHMPTDVIYGEVNYHSTCLYCGKDIMQDSQGNWFTYKEEK